jgi:hypothetical protein
MNNSVSASTMFQPNGAPSTDGEILTVMDVAHFLRVPKSTVYKLGSGRRIAGVEDWEALALPPSRHP